MGAFGPLDPFDIPRPAAMRDTRAEADVAEEASEQPPRRWWFSFDHSRSVDLDAEFVLA